MTIRAIIFDCFGVLTEDVWHTFRVSLPPEQSKQAHDLNRAYCTGQIARPEFLRRVAQVSGRSEMQIASLVSNTSSKNLPLLEYIATLKPSYKIGLLSNVANNWICDYLLTSDEQKLFDAMVLSFKVGISKPDPLIYRLATERLGVLPQECVFIDDIDRYAAAAEQMGMKALVYQDFKQMKHDLEKLLN